MTVQSRYVKREKPKCRLLFADTASFPVELLSFDVQFQASGSRPGQQTVSLQNLVAAQIGI